MTNAALGYGACAVACLGFGSNLVPAKLADTGDGVLWSLYSTCGIWLVGLIVQIVRNETAQFEPIAMIGGACWATGNMLVVPIIKLYGLSLGLLVWGIANMLMGWSSGHFGLFGLDKDPTLPRPWLNYLGVALTCLSLVVFSKVKSEVSSSSSSTAGNGKTTDGYDVASERAMLLSETGTATTNGDDDEDDPFAFMPQKLRQIVGFGLSVFIGCLYGTNFDPAQYLVDHADDGKRKHSKHSIDYVFSHFTGILATTMCYFVIYLLVKKYLKQKPILPDCGLWAFVSGAAWGVAQVSWFIANENLTFSISFPIIASAPGIIGALWGVFVFGEISGKESIRWLCVSATVMLCGVMCIALSRQ